MKPAEVAQLKGRVKELERVVTQLVLILHTHARTDLAPDACLPRMEKLKASLVRPKKPAGK